MQLSMRWSREFQVMRVDGAPWAHEGRTITTPAHDFCHLVVAAHGRALPWRPSGAAPEISIAEWNTVQVQRLYQEAYRQVVGQPEPDSERFWTVGEWNRHGRWYAVDHSKKYGIDFPAHWEACAGWFARAVRPELVARLFPIYAQVVAVEADAEHPPLNLDFSDAVDPEADANARKGQAVILGVLDELKRRHAPEL